MAKIDLTKTYDYQFYPTGIFCKWRVFCVETNETLCYAESEFDCKNELMLIAVERRNQGVVING